MDNLVSIVMPTFNCGKYIGETIESILRQTYNNWELFVIDDASTDNTEEIVKKYKEADNRINYIKFDKNKGAAEARTLGIKMSSGDYIAFLDSDDLWTSNKLKEQLKFMNKNNYNISCASYEQIDENGIKNGKVIRSVQKSNYNRVLLDCPIGNSTVIYNAKELGKFVVPNIAKRNDDALWLTMLKKEKYIFGYPEVLMLYRIRKNSISSNKIKLIKYHWILYREIEKLSVIRSSFHVFYWIIIKILKIK